jgi:tRNA (cmo5U34)-methyltransferase
MTDQQWTEESSAIYQQLAMIAVPGRVEQIAALLMLLPFGVQDTFCVAELASGEGILAYAILRAFPNATVLELDYSEAMRETTANRLKPFANRFEVAAFDMHQSDWHPLIEGINAVLSSLCIHHLDGTEKQNLFRAVRERIAEPGAFLIADLVQGQRPEANAFFGATLESAAQKQSIEHTGTTGLYENVFIPQKWNYYRYPDPLDKPSPLFHQLRWLDAAGFTGVDCFWMQAGHAIYGGYVGAPSDGREALTYEAAFAAAREALSSR